MFARFEDRFAVLDALPDSLYDAVVTHGHGELLPRVRAVLQWRACLLAGRLPDNDQLDWPEAFIRRTILMRLETLEIAQYCSGQETLTDSILLDVLAGIRSAEHYFALQPGGFVDKLAQRQKIKNKDSSFRDEEGLADHVERQGPGAAGADVMARTDTGTAQFSATAAQADTTACAQPRPDADAIVPTDARSTTAALDGLSGAFGDPSAGEIIAIANAATAALNANWQELAASWRQLSAVYGELGALLGRGWDLSQGVLAAQGWRDIVRYRQLLEQLPELRHVIEQLGRLRQAVGTQMRQTLDEQVLEPLKRPQPEERPRLAERVPMETGGVMLSDDLTHQLPSELAMLGHPRLKWLWHARRAERRLLTYCHCGLQPQPEPVEQVVETQGPPQPQASSLTHGPIILCLDTSASMHGAPETIAKAVVLEGLRLAYRENRACHVYAFSGPGQLLGHELDLTRGGLLELLAFLRQSFHGGTDVVSPLLAALAKQQSAAWRNADILLLTDGRFPLQRAAFDRIERLKQRQGLRLHGLLLGNWRSPALQALCDPLHDFSAWAAGSEML